MPVPDCAAALCFGAAEDDDVVQVLRGYASIRAAFFRLADAERELLEQSAMALRHDVALTSVRGEEGCLEVATDDIAVQIDDPSVCAVDAAGDPAEEGGAREICL
ncbi:hypothetical protein TcBrA4_0114480 [Trypanosoma cruzi]|nr:hypothetical protein TcBrA4_0114480 [Trypanosoma cruzi]